MRNERGSLSLQITNDSHFTETARKSLKNILRRLDVTSVARYFARHDKNASKLEETQ